MKIFNFFLISTIVFSLISCNSDTKKKVEGVKKAQRLVENIKTYHGEFIHIDTAAVLKGNSYIYGIKMDSTSFALIDEIKPLKKTPYDVVNIIVKGELNPNENEEGWEEILTIKSVEKVYPPKTKQESKVIKYSSKQNE